MEIKSFYAQDELGNILPGATCSLLLAGTSTLATGLENKDGNPLSNPFNADIDGLSQFSAPDGIYDLRVESGALDSRVRVEFGSVAQLKADLASPDGAGLVGYLEEDVAAKLSDFKSISDFAGASDAAKIVAAEAYCVTNGKTLRIDRNLSISNLVAPIPLRCDLYQQHGTAISLDNATTPLGLFKFTTVQSGTNLVGVGGLAEGSTRLTGVGTTVPGSWVDITSSEELIKDTSAGQYFKQEIAVFVDTSGGLSCPLAHTYSAPTVTLYARERDLLAEGLNIVGSGVELTDGNATIVAAEKRGIRLVNPRIVGTPCQGSQISLTAVPRWEVRSPELEGSPNGNGYGVLAFRTDNGLIEDPNIYNCRHGYAARHDKNTTIRGSGRVAEIIDSHYGYNLSVDGIELIGQVQYAGRDISVTNCQQTPKDYCIRIRNTSPELKGKVIYEGNTVNVDPTRMAGTHFAYITSGLSSGTFVFGRNLKQPDLVSIKGNHLNLIGTPTNISYARMLTATGFEYDLPTRFEIEGNTRTDYAKTIDLLAGYVKADNVAFSRNPVVYCRGEENCRVSVTSNNTVARLGEGYALDLHELKSFILFMNTNAIVDSRLDNIDAAGWALPAGGAQAQVDNGRLRQRGMALSGAVPVEISLIMSGEIFFKSMPDDTASYFRPGKDFGHLSVVTQNSLAWSGMMAYDVQTSGAFNLTVNAGANFATTTGVLGGTTGADTFLTLSAATDQKVYVENRAGAALTIQIKELSFGQ